MGNVGVKKKAKKHRTPKKNTFLAQTSPSKIVDGSVKRVR